MFNNNYMYSVAMMFSNNAIMYFIFQLQSDWANLSTAVQVWDTLVKSKNLEGHIYAIKEQRQKAVEDVFFVAHVADPKHFGEFTYKCINN